MTIDILNLRLLRGRPKHMLGIPPLLAIMLVTTVVLLAVQDPVSAVAQDSLQNRNVALEVAKSTQSDEPELLVRNARVPIFVDIDLGALGGTPAVPDDAVSRVVAALDANPRRLITLRFKGGALRFSDLMQATREALLDWTGHGVIDAYNRFMAEKVRKLISDVDSARASVPIAILGLPFNSPSGTDDPANKAYREIADRQNAVVIRGGLIVSRAGDQIDMLFRVNPVACQSANGRPILFTRNGQWQIAFYGDTFDFPAENASDLDERPSHAETEPPLEAFDGPSDGSSILGLPSDEDLQKLQPVNGHVTGAEGVGSNASFLPSRPQSSPSAVGGGSGGGLGHGDAGVVWLPMNEVDPAQDVVDLPEEVSQPSVPSDDPTSGEQDAAEETQDADLGGESDESASESPPGGGVGDLEEFPLAIPGDSLANEYESFAPVGIEGDFGWSSKAIAAWDVVPFQNLADGALVGVVAFHVNGIDRVQIRLNGGEWVEVDRMTQNPQTGVDEYFVEVDTSDLPAGSVLTVQAVVTPRQAGQVTCLSPLQLVWQPEETPVLWCSPAGSDEYGVGTPDQPFRQPGAALRFHQATWDHVAEENRCDHVRVYLQPGEYALDTPGLPYPATQAGWLTIAGSPNADPGEVRITSGSGIRSRLIRFQNLTFDRHVVPGRTLPGGSKSLLWLDSIQAENEGPYAGTQPYFASAFDRIYLTDSVFLNMGDGPKFSTLARGCHADSLGEDAFGGGRLILNCSATNVIQDNAAGAHSDVLEIFDSSEPTIIFGFVGLWTDGQGIFLGNSAGSSVYSDIAIVNVLISRFPGDASDGPPFSQIRGTGDYEFALENVLIDGLSLPNSPLLLEVLSGENLVIRNSLLRRLSVVGCNVGGLRLETNHYVDGVQWAEMVPELGSSSGLAQLNDFQLGESAGHDELVGMYSDASSFAPASASVLRGRVESRASPSDALGQLRQSESSIGAIE